MTATETIYPELSADLVEQVKHLPAEGLQSLRKLLEDEEQLEQNFRMEQWAEILSRVEAYDRGELQAYDSKEVEQRLHQRIADLKRKAQS